MQNSLLFDFESTQRLHSFSSRTPPPVLFKPTMSAATLAVPPAKLASLKTLFGAGVTASITFELAGPDGVATTSVLNFAEHRDRLAQLWVAAHTLPALAPDPLSDTRSRCNALGKQAVLWKEAAELAKEEECWRRGRLLWLQSRLVFVARR